MQRDADDVVETFLLPTNYCLCAVACTFLPARRVCFFRGILCACVAIDTSVWAQTRATFTLTRETCSSWGIMVLFSLVKT